MFRILHPNRWFFWTLVIVVATGGFLLYKIQQTVILLEKEALELPEPLKIWKVYKSQALALSVKYPASWDIELDPESANTFTLQNPGDYGENITFSKTDPKYEGVIRGALKISAERGVTIDNLEGTWIVGGDQKDKALSNVILVRRGDDLYYIAGQAKRFEIIVKSVKFSP